MTILIATSVVRGSRQGQSHGGVYLVDIARQRVAQPIDWNTVDIDWRGRGWDRGLRGIAFDGDDIYIAASDELFVYDKNFNKLGSYRSTHLKHCHEIFRYKRRLYLTSTGFDSLLGFDLDERKFTWGLQIGQVDDGFRAIPFLPGSVDGPKPVNNLHINSVYCTPQGLFVSGMQTRALLRYTGKRIEKVVSLPSGCHNAQPFADGVVFNDTSADQVRFISADKQRAFHVPVYEDALLTHTDFEDARVARQAFGRGLCPIGDGVFAAGSSPSTITLHDFETMQTTLSINLSMDVRNAIHGLEVWPFDAP